MLKQKFWVALSIISVIALTFTGCAGYEGVYSMRSYKPGMTQMRPLASKRTLIKRITAAKIQVVEEGDHLHVIIPIDHFFDIEKSTLRVSKQPALILVAELISLYGAGPLFVQGYSDNMGYDADNLRRSEEQANEVAAVLWAYGIDQRCIYVRGYGSKFSIADNGSVQGRAFNRRIEITK